jgi:transcriptional regulator of heat shock response
MPLTAIEKILFYNVSRSCIIKKKPIGSKLLAKKINNQLSAPSVRIYLRKMVRNGYLENEASRGRLPTDKGWYYYLRNYHLEPEIKIPDIQDDDNLENLLDLIAQLTKNIVFFCENELIIKGLKNALMVEEKELAEDWLDISENLEKIINNFQKEISILIGSKIQESKTKKLSLIACRKDKKIFGFLGPKINYYHTNLIIIKKILKNERREIAN